MFKLKTQKNLFQKINFILICFSFFNYVLFCYYCARAIKKKNHTKLPFILPVFELISNCSKPLILFVAFSTILKMFFIVHFGCTHFTYIFGLWFVQIWKLFRYKFIKKKSKIINAWMGKLCCQTLCNRRYRCHVYFSAFVVFFFYYFQ